jgi:hypothetical protein
MFKNMFLIMMLSSFLLHAESRLDQHPIILALQKYFFETPRDRKEQPITVTILGVTCKGSITVSADITTSGRDNTTFVLNYTKYVFLDARNTPDDCLEVTVPDIDTKFTLTFTASDKSDQISFTGEVPADCKECKPRRAKKISGIFHKIGKSKYRLSFVGDLADSLDLISVN